MGISGRIGIDRKAWRVQITRVVRTLKSLNEPCISCRAQPRHSYGGKVIDTRPKMSPRRHLDFKHYTMARRTLVPKDVDGPFSFPVNWRCDSYSVLGLGLFAFSGHNSASSNCEWTNPRGNGLFKTHATQTTSISLLWAPVSKRESGISAYEVHISAPGTTKGQVCLTRVSD